MKKALLVLFATGWFLCGFGQEIEFETTVHDFGQAKYNAVAEYDFVFTNTGTKPLILKKPKSSCNTCLFPSWPQDPIMPGNKDRITVTYKTNQEGSYNKTVTVSSNASKNSTIVLRVKGKVLSCPMPSKQNGHWGMEDSEGKVLIPFQYDELRDCGDKDRFIAQKNAKYGFIDRNNRIIIPFEYDVINKETTKSYEKYLIVQKNGKWGIMDLSGNIIVPSEYEEISNYDESECIVKKNGKWGFVAQNKVIIPCEYEELSLHGSYKDILFAKKNGKWGLIDRKNKAITTFFAKEIVGQDLKTLVFVKVPTELLEKNPEFSKYYIAIADTWGEIAVQNGGLWGAISTNGNLLIPPICEDASFAAKVALIKEYQEKDCNQLDSEKEAAENFLLIFGNEEEIRQLGKQK